MSNKVKIRIHDEVNITVVGLHGEHIDHFFNRYALFAANYFFNPKFKLGRWDGKISHFSKSGKTFLYLLPEILQDLVKFHYQIEIDDLRTSTFVEPNMIEMDVFSHVLHPDTGKPIFLRDYQVNAVNQVIQDGNGTILASTGAGKAQSLTSKILTPLGWKLMGDVQVGDQVLTPTGMTSNVIGVFPQGKKELFRITFHDGSSTLCCNEHLWKVRMPKGKLSSAKTYEQIVSLSEMRQFLDLKKASNGKIFGNISIDVIQPRIDEIVDILPIDPYVVGVLLGDGGLSNRFVMLSSNDQHILDTISQLTLEFDVSLKHKQNVDYVLIKNEKQNSCPPSPNKLTDALDKLGLIGTKSSTKFIPDQYKNSSLSNKIKLIQGLMDTDGTIDKRGNCSYTTVSYQLAKDLQEVLWSIGAICTITSRHPSYTYNGEKKLGQLAYTLHIVIQDRSILFTLPRKLERCHTFNNRVKIGRRVVDISLECVDNAQCIMIDDPNHLYITDDYIITHNTIICAAILQAYTPYVTKSITIVPDQTLVMQTYNTYKDCKLDVGEYSGKRKTLEHQHIVSTWQALQHNPMLMNGFDLVIVDECLDGDSQILMGDFSTKSIRDIQPGDEIISYNIQNNNIEKDVVIKQHKNLATSSNEKMYKLEFDNGHTLEITGNHKIYTTIGMVRADEITEEHEIIAV